MEEQSRDQGKKIKLVSLHLFYSTCLNAKEQEQQQRGITALSQSRTRGLRIALNVWKQLQRVRYVIV